MRKILDAILADEPRRDRLAPGPTSTGRSPCTGRDRDVAGQDSGDKDPRRSLHVEDVPTPERVPVRRWSRYMASAINFNTVWTFDLRTAVHIRLP